MLCLEVLKDGARVAFAGGEAVALAVTRVARNGREAAHLDLGGTEGRSRLLWADEPLREGDEINVAIVEREGADPPREVAAGDPAIARREGESLGFSVTVSGTEILAGSEQDGVLVAGVAVTNGSAELTVSSASDAEYLVWAEGRKLAPGDVVTIRLVRSPSWSEPGAARRWEPVKT